jgi:arginyl-tRNA synthetase
VITGDLDRVLAAQISPGRAPASGIRSAGTWRPAPPGSAPRPGTYATPVAFGLARVRGADPASVAAELADTLGRRDWVTSATVTGGGYLTVTVSRDALAALAVRITTAGPACARSTALAGASVLAPRCPGLRSANGWADARRRLSAFLSGRFAAAAAAQIQFFSERPVTPAAGPGGAPGPVARALDFAGAGAITYALARLPPNAPARVDPRAAAAHHLGVPAYAVRYAHAHAASTLRQAADLGLGLGEAAGFVPRLLAHPTERALLDELSWLPERVAGAARRARPDVLTRCLERLAEAYFGCQESSPAVWPGIGAGGPETVARLWLAAASRTALRAGLDLLGVDAPDRL